MEPTTITRSIDRGDPILLRDAPDARIYAVHTDVCVDPLCECRTMTLRIVALRGADTEAIRYQVDMDSGELLMEGPGNATAEIVEWIGKTLGTDETRALLRARFERERAEKGDPRHRQPLPATDRLVAYEEVFPLAFDLVVVHERRRYLLVDEHCLKPGCRCGEVTITLFDIDPDPAVELAIVRAPIERLQAARVLDGGAISGGLWRRVVEETGAKLARRYAQMRELAAEAAQVRVAAKVGRNEPCPCGSGHKFKRCCGAEHNRPV